ncbi:DedA family protein/thiosulfate sulfurtransferase GlpE [Accumulibacter sp.]|uniref:DedA family protein/thiosulfate sulfurtransferase GlpE n=1 Tax=Accumulibacter sp. TaxID=2053492 RepID=UPI002603FAAE|nr:DedA family protein/thiosulfate sulfurtransferase GlpE [Accumulibacter sp.]
MEQLPQLLAEYGAWALFLTVLLEQLGMPIPALPVLLVAGAAAADDPMYGVLSLFLAIIASTMGDFAWYAAGRRYGGRVLKTLCRISLSPDSCVRKTENTFERRGVATLVIAKFVPGLSTLAPPLAGAIGLRQTTFLVYNGAGAALWAGTGLIAGLLLHRQIDGVLAWMSKLGGAALALMGGLFAIYLGYRLWDRYRLRALFSRTRISPQELAEWLTTGHAPLILDARSVLARDLDRRRIPGARIVDMESLDLVLPTIPRDRDVVVYCSCPNDASAVQVAWRLARIGHKRVRPLAGAYSTPYSYSTKCEQGQRQLPDMLFNLF